MLTLTGVLVGVVLAACLIRAIGSLPFLGPIFENTSGQGDIFLTVSLSADLVSSSILTLVGLIAGMQPAPFDQPAFLSCCRIPKSWLNTALAPGN